METIGNLMMLAGLRVEHENSAFYVKIPYDSTAKNLRSTAKNLSPLFKSSSTSTQKHVMCGSTLLSV